MPNSRESVTIIHLSDLQFGENHRFAGIDLLGQQNPYDTLLASLWQDLQTLGTDLDLHPELILVTGDLTERGMEKEFLAVHNFLEGLRDKNHLSLPRHRLAIIPGNHDINRKACEAYFADCDSDDHTPLAPWWPKWRHYAQMFRLFYKREPKIAFTEEQPWTLFEIPELKIVIAGLNSTMPDGHDCVESATVASGVFKPRHVGGVGVKQLQFFKKGLAHYRELGWLRIAIVHHSVESDQLEDTRALKQALRPFLNLLLHGHKHEADLEFLDNNIPILGTGSAALRQTQRPTEIPNQYQLIQVTASQLRVFKRCYFPDRGKWGPDVRDSPNGVIEKGISFEAVSTTLAPSLAKDAKDLVSCYCTRIKTASVISGLRMPASEYYVQPSELLRVVLREVFNPYLFPDQRLREALPLAQLPKELAIGASKIIVLFGEAGIGKTTSCKWLRKELAQDWFQLKSIPVYIPLCEWQTHDTFGFFLDKQVVPFLGGQARQKGFRDLVTWTKATGCQLLLLLDGWNEQQPKALRKIQKFVGRLVNEGAVKVIITSRPVLSTDSGWFPDEARFFELQRWSDQQLTEYFRSHDRAELLARLSPPIRDCLRLPLLAFFFLTQAAGLTQVASAETSAELLAWVVDQCLQSMLRYLPVGNLPIFCDFSKEDALELLERIAYFMTSERILQIDAEFLQKELRSISTPKTRAMIAHLVNSGLLRCGGAALTLAPRNMDAALKGVQISFQHQILQEFLTAQFVLTHSSRKLCSRLPANVSTDAFWREVPIYMIEANRRSPSWQQEFVKSFYSDSESQDLFTAARLVHSISDIGLRSNVSHEIVQRLKQTLQEQTPYPQIIEAFRSLRKEGLDAARSSLESPTWTKIYAIPEATLLRLKPRQSFEVPWRRAGRAIYILGELGDFWLAEQLEKHLPDIVSLHLLYHAGEALLTLARLPNRTDSQRKLLLRVASLLGTNKVRDPVTDAYAWAISSECGQDRNDAMQLSQSLASFLEQQANTKHAYFKHGFWRRAHGSEAFAEVAPPDSCISVLTKLFMVEDEADYCKYKLGNYRQVHSSVLKAVGRSVSTGKGERMFWQPLLEAVFRSKRVAENAWACNHLETMLLRWFSSPKDLYWIREWRQSKALGGDQIRDVLSNVLWACEGTVTGSTVAAPSRESSSCFTPERSSIVGFDILRIS